MYFVYIKNLIISSKTPIKFTKRLKRIYTISILILFSLLMYKKSFIIYLFVTFIVPILANFLNIYDFILNKIFILKARKKLKNSNSKIIGITGSNGKTSVKNILLKMLETQYKTQATPSSYNTPIGIAKFINSDLKMDTEFLILEYGARHKKDVEKLCKIFGADYGIITTISSQHIETFHHPENIYKAKKKLADYLENKPCVYNIDNLFTLRMFNEKTGTKLSASIINSANVYAENIKIEKNKTVFNFIINNEKHLVSTTLLGRHNVLNFCLAANLALILNISIKNIISAVENCSPIPHRLSLLTTRINILDDSYNCSPLSSKESLWVLSQFSNKKMIATPGIIEGGKKKYLINFNLGKQLAHFDFCVIIGKENKLSLLNGIKSEVSSNSKLHPQIYISPTLENAKQYFALLKNGDTLLLLNDLPDDYK